MNLIRDKQDRPYIVITVYIKRKPYLALVDTGAANTVVCDTVRKKLKLKTKDLYKVVTTTGTGFVRDGLVTLKHSHANFVSNVMFTNLSQIRKFHKQEGAPQMHVILGLKDIINMRLDITSVLLY